jgi:hypothetical protein
MDDLASARDLNLRGTPFFLLGVSTPNGVKVTKVWSGARPVGFFTEAIEETLRQAPK